MTTKPAAPPDWVAIRHRYVSTDAKPADIARAAGITPTQLESRRKRDCWHRNKRKAKSPLAKCTKVKPSKQSPKSETATAPKARRRKRIRPVPLTIEVQREMLKEAAALIRMKIRQLEERMQLDLNPEANTKSKKPVSATDHERETRAIGSLIDNLGKVQTIQSAHDRIAGSSATADLARETEQYRIELSGRLKKLVDTARTETK